jgi:hypothetical protein
VVSVCQLPAGFCVETANGFVAKIPEPLFPTGLSLVTQRPYAVAHDGQRFLMPVPIDPRGVPPITVVLNWQMKLPKQ